MTIEIKTTQFVEMSSLFEGCRPAWGVFCDSEPKCSWGDNNRTLINASYIEQILKNWDEFWDDGDPKIKTAINTVVQRINDLMKLPDGSSIDDFYVDLEN